jgi:2-iminobutanoate/2-iminopropanoate deaminase
MKHVIALLIALIIIGCDHKRSVITTSDAPKPVGPYSQGILIDDRLYISGQIGWKADGTADTTTIEGETQQALENIKAILKAGGKTFADVSKVTIYCTDLNNFSKINSIYATYFNTSPPARETIQVVALPKNAHVEISAIAD